MIPSKSIANIFQISVPLATLILVLVNPVNGGETLHVPQAFLTIQAAIDAAESGDTIVVADGVYTGPQNRDLNLGGKNVLIRSENGASACTIDCQGTYEEPYRAFIFENGESPAAALDGFTITGGSTLQGAILDEFNGGAILIRDSSPTIRNCVFTGNTAGCWGGAVYSGFSGSPMIENCIFDGNYAGDDGGGFFCWAGSSPTILNCVFISNSAVVTGGGISVFGGSILTIGNTTIVENEALHGSGLLFLNGSIITNSIIWGNTGGSQFEGNPIVEYCNVEDGYVGVGNMDELPLFQTDGYHLRRNSPCLGAGDPDFRPAPGETDIDGQPRVSGFRVDIGADEYGRSTSDLKWTPGPRASTTGLERP